MRELSVLRNESYLFFESNGIFDGRYFGSRERLVRAACQELGIDYASEDAALSALYRSPEFRELDGRMVTQFAGLLLQLT